MLTILSFLGRLLRRPRSSVSRQPWVSQQAPSQQFTADEATTSAGNQLLSTCATLAPTLLEFCTESEQTRRLPLKLVELLKSHGFFRMTIPRTWGGLELDPVTQCRVIEELASVDAAIGWCVMIGSDGGYFSGFMDQAVAREMYQNIDAITGSGIFPAGKASWTSGGYRVSGRWRFGSGCQHSDWMAAGCMEYNLGIPCIGLNGIPKTRVCLLPASSVAIHDTWTTTGLRGSGSHDWTIDDVFVPTERTFDILQPTCYRSEALYQLPGMFMYNFPGVALGIARHALQTFVDVAKNKPILTKLNTKLADEPRIQSILGQEIARLAAARAFYYQALTDVWLALQQATPGQSDAAPFHRKTAYEWLTIEQRIRIRLAMLAVHEACIEVVTKAYKELGSASIYATGAMDRLLRDVHTVNQHVVVSTKVYETAGRLTIGLPPDEPFF